MEEEDQSENRNGYKVRAFASAIKVINQLDHPIRSIDEAKTVCLFLMFTRLPLHYIGYLIVEGYWSRYHKANTRILGWE